MQSKDRLTITLNKNLLLRLDSIIDGNKIRNRSHAIEYVIGKYLGAGITKAVILAGGDKKQCASSVLRIHNRPVIAYQIEQLKEANIRDLVIVINKKYPYIKEYLGTGKQWNLNITYIEDKKNTGTAQALLLAKQYIKSTFLMLYCDLLVDIDLLDFINFHQALPNKFITLSVAPSMHPHYFGVCITKGNLIAEYQEKPKPSRFFHLASTGIAVMEPSIFPLIKNNRSLGHDIFPGLAQNSQLFNYASSSNWYNVSYPDELESAEKYWKK